MKLRTVAGFTVSGLLLYLTIAALFPQPVFAAPFISISPRAGAPGTKVLVAGNNFTSYTGDSLTVFFDDFEVATTNVTASAPGSFQVTFQVPRFARAGSNIISVKTRSSGSLAEDMFTVPAGEVRLNTWGGTVQTPVSATARGFYSGKMVTFHYRFDGETEVVGTQTANETGECNLQFNVPASQRGKHSVTADNEVGQSASVDFEIIPSVTIESGTAAVGDKVILSGTGFTASNEVSVTLYDRTAAYARTTARGSFNAQFIVPVMKAGTYLVGIEDVSGEVKWVEINIASRVNINRNSGEVGARLTLTGTGFAVRSLVVVKFDSEEISWLLTDDTGAFVAPITVPASPAGVHIITATDGVSTYQVTYSVEDDAPVAPVPLTPKREAVVTPPLAFDWESVYDLSQPLTYMFQIARTSDFLHPIVEKSGLSQALYTLSPEEQLLPNRRGTYYRWRVRAIDGAANAGEWSEPAVFRVKPVDILPPWAKYVLIAVQALIVIAYGFQLRRGLAGKKELPVDS